MELALKYIRQNGIVAEQDYTYVHRDQACRAARYKNVVQPKSLF